MQSLKWLSLMKDVVICAKNLRLKSSLKVNRSSGFIEAPCNFDFPLFGQGGDSYLKYDF